MLNDTTFTMIIIWLLWKVSKWNAHPSAFLVRRTRKRMQGANKNDKWIKGLRLDLYTSLGCHKGQREQIQRATTAVRIRSKEYFLRNLASCKQQQILLFYSQPKIFENWKLHNPSYSTSYMLFTGIFARLNIFKVGILISLKF